MKKLIINADDFGLHKLVNEGIIRGHEDGLITSTSLMPSGQAFEHAKELALAHPQLGIGVHLTLVAERTLTVPNLVPSLVDDAGRMPADYGKFLVKFVKGQVNLEEIRMELLAQVEKVLASGLTVTHLDSHQHLHVFPGIIDIVIDIAKHFNIKAMRIPDEPYLFLPQERGPLTRVLARDGLTFLAKLARKKAINKGINVPEHFFGMLSGGNMHGKSLAYIIQHLPQGVSEIMMHPGSDNAALNSLYNWRYHWQEEMQAVLSTDVKQAVKEQQISMISFGALTHV